MKRLICILLAIFLTATAFVGCERIAGSESEATSEQSESSESDTADQKLPHVAVGNHSSHSYCCIGLLTPELSQEDQYLVYKEYCDSELEGDTKTVSFFGHAVTGEYSKTVIQDINRLRYKVYMFGMKMA